MYRKKEWRRSNMHRDVIEVNNSKKIKLIIVLLTEIAKETTNE